MAQTSTSAPLNNKFGIHIAKPHEEDIEDAAELVNGTRGGWGYVTVVMQEDDRNREQWQNKFNMMRELKLIPIIRLATKPEGGNWRRPTKEDAGEWVDFLESLNWVVKDRYIILFNEPNHATEWGGSVDPQGYAEVAQTFAQALNARNGDYVVMLAGLDAAAPSAAPSYEDSGYFLRTVVSTMGVDKFNEQFEAYASHSYPNPGFVGSPGASGKGTVRSYQWELNLLQELGARSLPVFITETGWNADALGHEVVADYFEQAFSDIWIPDDRVRAVTPFILNYQGEPFLKFSWRKYQSTEFYPQFYQVKGMTKVFGQPAVNEKGRILFDLPTDLVEDSNYRFVLTVENNGQGYWDDDQQYRIVLEPGTKDEYLISDLFRIRPGDRAAMDFFFDTDKPSAPQTRRFVLYRGDQKVLESEPWKFTVLALPSLRIHSKFFPKVSTNSDDFEIQIFDENEQIVYKRNQIEVKDDVGTIEAIRNIAYGKTYRIVLLHEGYLPRQTYVTFTKGNNEIEFERMLPFDFNGDGAMSFGDIWQGITEPQKLQNLMP